MSNLAMANLTAAAVPRQQEAATGSVAKKDSAHSKTQQVDVHQEVITAKEGVAQDAALSKTSGKVTFNALLQKHLTHEPANDKSGTPQSKKQAIVNKGDTSETKKSETTEKENKDTLSPLLSAAWFTPQMFDASKKQNITAETNSKSLLNKTLKIVPLAKAPAVGTPTTAQLTPVKSKIPAQAAAVENTKTVDGKEVTAAKQTTKDSKSLSAVTQKEVKETAEIKDTAAAAKVENQSKNAVSTQISGIPQQKQADQQNPGTDSNTAGKDKPQLAHILTQVQESTEDTKTDKSSLTTPKTKTKAQTSTTAEPSETTQTVISPRQSELNPHVATRRSGAETISAKEVTATSTEKSAAQQAVSTPSEQIIDRVQNTITGSTQQIQVTLTPAELGTIRITFRQQDGQIEGLMEVQNPEVRKDVEKALPQITAALAQNGIQVRRMDIVPMPDQQQPNQESFPSPGHEFNLADQHYLNENGTSGGSGSSGQRISGQDGRLADGALDTAGQGYDLSGLNMFA